MSNRDMIREAEPSIGELIGRRSEEMRISIPPTTDAATYGEPGHPRRPRDYSDASTPSYIKEDVLASQNPILLSASTLESPRKTTELTAIEQKWINWPSEKAERFFANHGKCRKVYLYARGPRPKIIETAVRPLLPKVERFFDKLFRPLLVRRKVISPIFLFAWLTVFVALVVKSWYHSTDSTGSQPSWIGATSTFWERNDGCGVNGTQCEPFSGQTMTFRCPGATLSTQLLNVRSIGSDLVIYEPLVVGGFDDQATYRADSWICAAAIQQGLFGDARGGCGQTVMTGQFEMFQGGDAHGVKSVGFDSVFPSTFRFNATYKGGDCADLRDDILGFDVAMSFILSFIVRASPQTFFWVLLVMGYWHVTFASDPSANPPDLEQAFKGFLPTIFFGLAFWRFSFRWVVPAFETAFLERTIWYLAGFWMGLLINISLGWIPISRLTPHDIQQRPGGLVAVIVVFAILAVAVLNQARVIRKTGWLFQYLFWYAVGGIIFALLCFIPTLDIRLHHYIAAIVLLPGLAFVTRPSAVFQGFLLGMFLDGAARWGFDSILQYPSSLVGDGALGTSIPEFWTSATNITSNLTSIAWKTASEAGVPSSESWDGFDLIVDDVLRYSGNATTFDVSSLARNLTHYFRIAYTSAGSPGDFSKAATLFLSNYTWIDPLPGPT